MAGHESVFAPGRSRAFGCSLSLPHQQEGMLLVSGLVINSIPARCLQSDTYHRSIQIPIFAATTRSGSCLILNWQGLEGSSSPSRIVTSPRGLRRLALGQGPRINERDSSTAPEGGTEDFGNLE